MGLKAAAGWGFTGVDDCSLPPRGVLVTHPLNNPLALHDLPLNQRLPNDFLPNDLLSDLLDLLNLLDLHALHLLDALHVHRLNHLLDNHLLPKRRVATAAQCGYTVAGVDGRATEKQYGSEIQGFHITYLSVVRGCLPNSTLNSIHSSSLNSLAGGITPSFAAVAMLARCS